MCVNTRSSDLPAQWKCIKNRGMRPPVNALLLALLIASSHCAPAQSIFRDEELVTFYPTYGYLRGDHWIVPRLRFRVHEPRRALLETTAQALRLKHTGNEVEKFKAHADGFFQDDQSAEKVTFKFDLDGESFQVLGSNGRPVETDGNGMAEGMITIPVAKAQALLNLQRAKDNWLTFTATSPEHSGAGRIQLISPKGKSVISDIDDTIKVTGIPQGKRTVVENTFFKDFIPATGMIAMYREWKDKADSETVAFHYVSGGFWQLYKPLDEFLMSDKIGFPKGTFHMRLLPLKVTELPSLIREHGVASITPEARNDPDEQKPRAALNEEPGTYGHKVGRIREIMNDFPNRTFILVGDSGEKDPEVYQKIKSEYGERVTRIIIREPTKLKSRTEAHGMEVIHLTAEGAEILPSPAPAAAVP